MTVEDLINELQKCDPDSEVYFGHNRNPVDKALDLPSTNTVVLVTDE